MNTAFLATLVAAIDKGSLAAAASEVGCSPSAVSLQMKQLESYFGQPLFDRSTRAVKATRFAHDVAAVARDFSVRLDGLRTRPSMAVAGRLRLGAIASVQTDALPQALRSLRHDYPKLQVEVTSNDSAPLLVDLRAGRIDMAVLIRPSAGGSSRLVWHNLTRQSFVMLVPPDSPRVPLRSLLEQFDLIRYDITLTGGRIAARYLQKTFPGTRQVMDVRAIEAIVALVSAGLGVSIVPRPRQALLDAHGVSALSLGRNGPTRQIATVWRKADHDNRNINAAVRSFVSAYSGLLAPTEN